MGWTVKCPKCGYRNLGAGLADELVRRVRRCTACGHRLEATEDENRAEEQAASEDRERLDRAAADRRAAEREVPDRDTFRRHIRDNTDHDTFRDRWNLAVSYGFDPVYVLIAVDLEDGEEVEILVARPASCDPDRIGYADLREALSEHGIPCSSVVATEFNVEMNPGEDYWDQHPEELQHHREQRAERLRESLTQGTRLPIPPPRENKSWLDDWLSRNPQPTGDGIEPALTETLARRVAELEEEVRQLRSQLHSPTSPGE